MKQPTLTTAWSASRKAGSRIHPHSHAHYELVYYTAGVGESRIGSISFVFSPGQFALIAPGTEHSELHQKSGHLICIGFQWEADLPGGLFPDTDGLIGRICQQLLKESVDQPPEYEEMLRLKLRELLITLGRLRGAGKSGTKNITYTVNYIAENCREKIHLPALAAQLNLSYDYFRHQFAAQVGCSPQQFLIKKRLEAAGHLLEETPLSCTEIAYRCGFSNSAQFSMLFKKSTGLTPLQYRRK